MKKVVYAEGPPGPNQHIPTETEKVYIGIDSENAGMAGGEGVGSGAEYKAGKGRSY